MDTDTRVIELKASRTFRVDSVFIAASATHGESQAELDSPDFIDDSMEGIADSEIVRLLVGQTAKVKSAHYGNLFFVITSVERIEAADATRTFSVVGGFSVDDETMVTDDPEEGPHLCDSLAGEPDSDIIEHLMDIGHAWVDDPAISAWLDIVHVERTARESN
jgi:hypothetical protein